MTQSLRWGILGTGMIAAKFAADLKYTSQGVLVASGSRRQQTADSFAVKHGGRGIGGYEALINDPDVDAVYISLPNGLHAEWSIKAMEAGKDVLCEKPIACNTTEAETIADIAEPLGIHRDALLAAVQDPAIKERLKIETTQALEAGVFGSPFVIIDGEPFWGSDRLWMIRQWLKSGGW